MKSQPVTERKEFKSVMMVRLQFGGIAIVLIAICLLSVSTVAANRSDVSSEIVKTETDIKAYDYEKNKELITALEADIAVLEGQIEIAQQDKKAAEEDGDSLGVMRAELMISSYTRELTEKQDTLMNYRLQADIDVYYIGNKDKLVADSEAQIQYECYNIRLIIAECNAQIKYLKARQAELEKKLAIEQKKLELGYTIEVEVNNIRSQLQETQLLIEESELEIEFQKEMLTLYGEEEIAIELPRTVSNLEGDFVSQFVDSSAQIKYYEQQITAYSNYIAGANESDEKLQEMKLRLQLAQLNKQQYQSELEKYVKQTKKSYNQAKLNVEKYDSQIEVARQQIRNAELLYEKGRIREIDVMELETEKSQLEYERIGYICDAQRNRYLLEHNIEN